MPLPDSPEYLLEEARWLERVARGLVGDLHLAQDLAQDAWLAARSGDARITGARRAWLTGTVRRLAARAFRGQRRRRDREQSHAIETVTPSAAELTARAELHEQLLGHVRALPETYRVPLLLRFYDDLPPRRIATRLGLPVRTVHTRLSRALAMLRERLDQSHARGRAGWVAALLTPTSGTPAPWPPRTGWLVAAAGALIACAWSIWPAWQETPRPAATKPLEIAAAEPVDMRSTPGVDADRRKIAVAAAMVPWRGTVLDWHGQAMAGAIVRVAPHLGLLWRVGVGDETAPELRAGPATPLSTPTDALGYFVGDTPTTAVEVRAEANGYTTVLVGIWRPGDRAEPRVVVARSRALHGCVVSTAGLPLAGASVVVRLPDDHDASNQRGSAGLHALSWSTTTDAGGSFGFRAVPDLELAEVEIRLTGYEPRIAALSAADATSLALQPWPHTRRGRLVDRHGQPVAGAVVATTTAFATTADDGTFLLRGAAEAELIAAAADLAPQALQRPAGATDHEPWLIEQPALAIDGVVRSADGRGVAGVEVTLADPTVVGDGTATRVLEAVAADNERAFLCATADEQGRFHLGGLAAHPYRLRVVDPATAAWFATEPQLPGEPTTLVVPTDWLLETLALDLVTAVGPLAGATVTVQGTRFAVRRPGQANGEVIFVGGAGSESDATGHLVLHQVPRRGVELRIAHATTGLTHTPIEVVEARGGHIELARIGELGVRYASAVGGEWLEVHNAGGQPVELQRIDGISALPARRWSLIAGRSPILVVPETGVQLCIGSGADMRVKVPLVVRPGQRIFLDL